MSAADEVLRNDSGSVDLLGGVGVAAELGHRSGGAAGKHENRQQAAERRISPKSDRCVHGK